MKKGLFICLSALTMVSFQANADTIPMPNTTEEACTDMVMGAGLAAKTDALHGTNHLQRAKKLFHDSFVEWGYTGFNLPQLAESEIVRTYTNIKQSYQFSHNHPSKLGINQIMNNEMNNCMSNVGDVMIQYDQMHSSVLGN